MYLLLKEGIKVSVPESDSTPHPGPLPGRGGEGVRSGGQKTERVRVVDWEQPANNDFLLVSQFSVTGALYTCRPDLVGFINGLPLVVIELKKPGVPTRGVRRESDNLQTSADRHPGVVRVQRAAHRLERHGQRRRLAHGGLGAVQAFEHASALLDQDASRFRPHLSGFCQEKNAFLEFLYCVSH